MNSVRATGTRARATRAAANNAHLGARLGSAQVKVLVVGDGAVGKTSTLLHYVNGSVDLDVYVPTIFDNYSCVVNLNGEKARLDLWDTAGQEDYDRLRALSYGQTDVIVLMFAVDRTSSFENIEDKWMPELRAHLPDTPIFLVGTKCDQRDNERCERANLVSAEAIEATAKRIGAISTIEVSAQTGKNINSLFTMCLQHYLYLDQRGGGKRKKGGKKGKCDLL